MSEVSEFFSEAPQTVGQGRGPQTGQEMDGKSGYEPLPLSGVYGRAAFHGPKGLCMEGGPDPDFVLGPTTPAFACVNSDERDRYKNECVCVTVIYLVCVYKLLQWPTAPLEHGWCDTHRSSLYTQKIHYMYCFTMWSGHTGQGPKTS